MLPTTSAKATGTAIDQNRMKKTGAQNNKAGALQKERPALKGRE
jgi:hypothetical protein